jgi:hypothetical protein
MPTLYEDGWRQGTILAAHLPLDAVLLGGGQPVRDQREHRLWAVASQECDLDQTDHAAIEATIELRPVFTDDPPDDFGIRSSRFLLTEHEYVISISPRTVVSAAVLTELVRQRAERRDPSMARRQAFKTWQGCVMTGPPSRPRFCPSLKESLRRCVEDVDGRGDGACATS